MIHCVIYRATNTINGKVYVGKTTEWPRRKERHIYDAKQGDDCIFHRAINRYGEESFVWDILCELDTENIDCANHWCKAMEITHIALNHSYVGQYPTHGYNMTIGGEGTLGLTRSEKTKAKMSASQKGRKHSLEAIEKNRQAHLGKKASEETKKKQSEVQKKMWEDDDYRAYRTDIIRTKCSSTGIYPSEETRAKMSAAKSGDKHPNYGKHLSDTTKEKISSAQIGVPKKKYLWLLPDGSIKVMDKACVAHHHKDWQLIGLAE